MGIGNIYNAGIGLVAPGLKILIHSLKEVKSPIKSVDENNEPEFWN